MISRNDKKIGFIYVLKDPISLQIVYVGLTTKTIKQRLISHLNGFDYSTSKINNWLRKIVKNNLKPVIECIETVEYIDIIDLNNREIYWIEYFRSKNIDLKNITSGGKSNYNYENINLQKVVYQYNLNGEFIQKWDSVCKVEKELKIDSAAISKCCNNIRQKAGNFKWSYEYKNKIDRYIRYRFDRNYNRTEKGNDSIKKALQVKILQYNKNNILIKEWESITIAANNLNISKIGISNCLAGRSKTSGNYIWRYVK